MKKVLFTLVALFMATTAFATNRIWIEETHIKADQIGKNFTIPIHVEADAYFNAWQLNMTPSDGISLLGAVSGSDASITYYNSLGIPVTEKGTTTLKNNNAFGYAYTDTEYDENGNECGAVKWAAGTYDEMALMYVKITDENFTEGTITLTAAFLSAGKDTRETVGDKADALPDDVVIKIINDDAVTPEPVVVDLPVITDNKDNSFSITTTVEGGTIYYGYSAEGPWTEYTEAVPVTEETTVYAYVVDADGNASEIVNEVISYTAPKEPVATPEIVQGDNSFTITSEVEGGKIYYGYSEDGPWYEYDGNAVAVTETTTVYAYVEDAEGDKSQVVSKEIEYVAPEPTPDPDPEPVTKCAMPSIISYEADGTVYMAVDAAGAATDYLWYETVTWSGITQRVAANFTLKDNCENCDGCVLKYMVATTSDDVTGVDGVVTVPEKGTWYEYTDGDIIRVTRDLGLDITILAQCPACGELGMSDIAVQRILFDAIPTGVEETVAGKTVANTRYFNMAGQEMSEANGVTIVVTTYTDGTVVANKVMK